MRRRAARAELIAFTEFTFPGYAAAEHHHEIAEHLEAVEQGYVDRLMIFTFPRGGKSELASRRFPAWFMGRNPHKNIIASSYNSDLAGDFGREVRNIVNEPAYRELFPAVTLAADSQAGNRWHTNKGGGYVAAGVGTATTGRGAHVFLIDDPVKDRESADSPVIQKRTWDWYRAVAYTRLDGVEEDDAQPAIVLIQTRWNEADLAGLLLDQMKRGGDQWTILDLPAITDGKALWPKRFDMDRLNRIRANIGERDWNALYMQRPSPDEGSYFKREWLRYYDQLPGDLRIYGASDYAVTEDGGDYTVHMVAGLARDGDLYLIDLWREQASSDVWVEALLDLVVQHAPSLWLEEGGPIAKAVAPLLLKRSQEREVFVHRELLSSIHNKEVRARAIQGRFGQGRVHLPRNAEWTPGLVSELLHFPAGKTDDQVDTLGLFGRFIARMRRKPEEETKEEGRTLPNITLDDLWREQERNSRRRRKRKGP